MNNFKKDLKNATKFFRLNILEKLKKASSRVKKIKNLNDFFSVELSHNTLFFFLISCVPPIKVKWQHKNWFKNTFIHKFRSNLPIKREQRPDRIPCIRPESINKDFKWIWYDCLFVFWFKIIKVLRYFLWEALKNTKDKTINFHITKIFGK